MGYIAIVVDDYDKAIDYYTNKLGFTLVEDTPQLSKSEDIYGNRLDLYQNAIS
nr:VOC family protein [Xenorhabdus budapestensis]